MLFAYGALVEKFENEVVNAGRQLAEKTADQADTYIEELDLLAEQVKHQPKITGVFYTLQKNHSEENQFNNEILDSIDVSSALKGLLTDRTANYSIFIYNEFGDVVSSQDFLINKNKIPQITLNYNNELEKINQNNGTLVLSPQKNSWTDSETMYITFKKELKNNYSSKVCGIIEVRADINNMIVSIGLNNVEDGTFFIRDRASGSVIYPYNYDSSEYNNVGYITAPLKKTSWEIAIKTPEPATKTYGFRILILFILIYIFLLVFLFILTENVGRYVTKPISRLADYVRKIDTPDDGIKRIDGEIIDEIKELEDSFDKMLERMNKSTQQEKKAYSLALQAQMNPHFLYNMLAVISSAGSEAGCDRVSDMCIELSDMLRYVTAYQAVTVTLKDEVEHTKHYLFLMKSRYEDYFTYDISIDDELMNMAVPKLFIQPLTENCFNHGFKEKEPPWNIHISMTGSVDNWTLIIKDNGTGISDDKIAKINSKIEKAMSNMTVGEIGGLGIVNTIVRLKMTHNEKITYKIYNETGMVIEITSRKAI
jgi:sensor histidine kinase YesM